MVVIILLFSKYLVSTYYVPGTKLALWRNLVSKTGKNSCPPGGCHTTGARL